MESFPWASPRMQYVEFTEEVEVGNPTRKVRKTMICTGIQSAGLDNPATRNQDLSHADKTHLPSFHLLPRQGQVTVNRCMATDSLAWRASTSERGLGRKDVDLYCGRNGISFIAGCVSCRVMS